MDRESQRMWQIAARYSTVGIEMAASVGFGTWGGWWLDKQLGTTPYLFWLGVIIGVGAAIRAVLRVVKEFKRMK